MKRLILGLALLLAPISLFGQGQYLKQSTATQVTVELVSELTGGFTTSDITGSVEFQIVKHTDSGAVTETFIYSTDSGGSNDLQCDAQMTCNFELTTTNTDTLGRLHLAWRGTDIYPGWKDFTVRPAAGVLCDMEGSCITIDGIWEYALTSIGDAGSVGTLIETKLGTSVTVQYATAFANYPIYMKSSAGEGVAGLADLTCKISQDGAAASTTNDTAEAEVDAGDLPGLYVIDLTAGELTANVVNIQCVTAGDTALPFDTYVTPQR
jgi:hypothetical protein